MKLRSAWRDVFGDYWTNEEYNAIKNLRNTRADVDLSTFTRVFIMSPSNVNINREPYANNNANFSVFFPPF
jgi:hypothetical protein